MVESRLNKPIAIAAIVVALVLGVMLGIASGVVDRIFGGPDPKTIATSSLESMRAQNRLITFVARYVSVVSSEQKRLGGLVSTERTLILPGNVRYEVDLSRLQQKDEACLLKLTELVAMRRPEYCAHMEAERLKRVRGES